MAKFFKRHWSTLLLGIILLTGLVLLLYPTVADWWNSFHQSKAVASYVRTVENMTDNEREKAIAAANEYNRRLAKEGIHFVISEEEQAEYDKLLDLTGTGIMGYVQIPAIDVSLPIYHGTSEMVLQVAAGHLTGTSLPIGGESTHTAISGHRGLPSARLFTDLDDLVVGDVFTITVLDHVITYMVDQIRIVYPYELDELAIEEGRDYCTLITCTPYGVNSHRMLVRGTRIENAREAVVIVGEANRIQPYIVIPMVAIPILFVLLTVMFITLSVRKPRKPNSELLDEFKKKP